MNIHSATNLYFWLIGAHLLCDFSLQGDTMAREKNPYTDTPLHKYIPWWYWMLAHSLIHGMAVALVTNSIALGVAEAGFHAAIDITKCAGLLNIHADQFLHLFCKVLWGFVVLNPMRLW